ncbi:disintegrin and metalloproteinase domain-containing protein 9 isoform X1 [Tachysurus fulvidraco]|uniref:disintegrin and metalloproteinase domain-containing protein 9 isoform X1 n=2 Tax=Tachysurus fulvidraco TaxID=1234273 RepID=UPI001FEEE4C1|nr:disintegrin and metalloproteinase domain-containing protein 9 isoform X1 [Tachysurus fulvidraco]
MGGEETRRNSRRPFFTVLLIFIHIDGIITQDLFHEQTSNLKDFQIVIPQLVHKRWQRHDNSTRTHEQTADSESLTYSIKIDNIVHLLHLTKNKDFLSPDFTVVSHDVRRNAMKKHKEKPVLCHYYGRVSGYEESLVALSTCDGLRGVIFMGNKSYALEPALHAKNNEHILFPVESSKSEPFVCGVDTEHDFHGSRDHTLFMDTFLRKKRNLPQTRYVELALVVDNLRFKLMNSNVVAVRNQTVQLANLLDTYFQQLNIRIVLVGLEIFNTSNPFDVKGNPVDVLGSFVSWRKSNLLPRVRNDMAQLIVGLSGAYSGGILGMAYVGTVCSAGSGGGISVFSDNGLQYYSTILAHEMGHNLGMNHDTSSCQCGGNTCIMNPSATGSTLFSQCSDNDFENLVLRGGGVCLLNQPSPENVISMPMCGNQILEGTEECDCGPPETCNNKCCDAATCTFTKGSVCAAGVCCKDCQVLVSGTPCRVSVNECDLPEYCTGQSGFCPPDTYLMDGLTCQNNNAYCYEGRCQTLDYQCKQLFGPTATKADDKCFSYVNTQGTGFGNCGFSGSSFAKCSVANSMCGKIQCTNFDSNFPPPGAIISVQNIEPGISCRNADFNMGPDVLDPGYVKKGTVCAVNKVCLNFNCVNSSVMTQGQKCNAATDCNSNGVCNNLDHCHCNNGWAPPDCYKWGRGGSIDSGPAQIDYSLRNGLLIFFLLVLPILVLAVFGFLYAFRRDSLNRCCRGRRSQRRRTNEANAQSNNQPSRNVQRPARPPPRSQYPQYPSPTSGTQSSSDSQGLGGVQPAVWTSQLPRNGPGVPRPIPPRNVVT